MNIKHIRKGDFYSGLALAALGAYIIGAAWQWTYMGEEGPGAGFFPLWYGVAMVVLSALLVAGAVLKGDANGGKGMKWNELRRAMMCWAAFAVTIALLNVLGFTVSFALLAWFIVAVMYNQPKRIALGIAIGGALAFYLIFSVGLGMSLPTGLLF